MIEVHEYLLCNFEDNSTLAGKNFKQFSTYYNKKIKTMICFQKLETTVNLIK